MESSGTRWLLFPLVTTPADVLILLILWAWLQSHSCGFWAWGFRGAPAWLWSGHTIRRAQLSSLVSRVVWATFFHLLFHQLHVLSVLWRGLKRNISIPVLPNSCPTQNLYPIQSLPYPIPALPNPCPIQNLWPTQNLCPTQSLPY